MKPQWLTFYRRVLVLYEGFVRKAGGVAIGSALGQGIQFLAIPVLARIYTPSEFGQWAFLLGLLVILQPVLTLRYEMAIPLIKDEEAVGGLIVALVFILLMVVMVLGGSICVLLRRLAIGHGVLKTILGGGDFAITGKIQIGLVLGLVVEGITALFMFLAIRKRAFSSLGYFYFVRGLGTALFQLLFGIMKLGALGLLMGWAGGQMVGWFLLWHDRAIREVFEVKDLAFWNPKVWGLLKKHRKFPYFMSPAGVLNTLGLRIPSLLLVFLYGTEVTGWYAMAVRLVDAPSNIITSAMSQVYLGEASLIVRRSPEKLLPMFRQITRYMAALGVLVVPLLIGASQLVSFLLGKEWAPVGAFILVLLPYLVVKLIVSPISLSSVVAQRQELQFLFDGGRVLLTFAVMVVGYGVHLPAVVIIAGYSFTMAILYSVYYLFYLHLAKRVSATVSYEHQ